MDLNADLKAARTAATRDYFAGGTLDILSAGGLVLVSFRFTARGGHVAGPVWTMEFVSPKVRGLAAAGDGQVASKAQLRALDGSVGVTGLTVGTRDADITLTSTRVVVGQDAELLDTPTWEHA
jgi:hypothetical protein